ncbi:MAG: hypothetical protein ABI878_00465 [Acidobacteriota bacterium]
MIASTRKKVWSHRVLSAFVIAICICASAACKRSTSTGGGIDILGPADETAEAGKVVADANEDLKKIKVLYDANIDKREELKKALEANDAAQVKKLADEIVYLINDGNQSGLSAVDKLQKAQELHVNDDYSEYLRLKEDSIKKELDAFEHYRQAARTLRDNYDPNNAAVRDKVKEEFKTRSENYQKTMEGARADSGQANQIAKDALKKQAN